MKIGEIWSDKSREFIDRGEISLAHRLSYCDIFLERLIAYNNEYKSDVWEVLAKRLNGSEWKTSILASEIIRQFVRSKNEDR